MKTLIKAWIGFWIIVGLSSCAGRHTWHGSGSNARHCDYREVLDAPDVVGWYPGSVQDRNTLRAAVYATQSGW